MDVHAASVQDCDGFERLLRQARKRFAFIERIIGDDGYQGPKMTSLVARIGAWRLEIVKRSDLQVRRSAGSWGGRWPGSAATGA